MAQPHEALITNDAVVMGMLAVILGVIFKTAHSQHRFWQKFYKYVPALLLCYFLPSLLNTFGIVDGHSSNVYYVASRFLLPACLILLTISIDLRAIINLGPKALIMFLTGTVGIVIGGPLAILVMSAIYPEAVGGHGPDAVWRGMTTIAGSWIGGGANQASMKEMFEVGGDIFSAMVTVDVIVANLWMAVLLLMAGNHKAIDAKTGADTTAIEDLKKRVEAYHAEHARMPTLNDYMTIIAIAFGITGFAHFCGDLLAPYFDQFAWAQEYSLNSKFFWLIVISTTIGISLSFTRVRHIEAFGASKVASSFLYILVASIGLHMNITAILDSPLYFVVGAIWMLTHASLMLIVAKLIKAPLFYMAVGSQANVGGAASAPVVASAFHPSLAPVGVLLAVLGYGVGTYMAYICGLIMQSVAP
ncbi:MULTISPECIES: DUF819 domain-containing protein [Pseudoalteromonas]|uniref:Membrane protein n=1 Tax=Pseudoalteromonas ruthenica TaxID=151081 RepID=A0A0F4PSB3_9GAMM|nr:MULTISPECIES: DUF819 family protein [Pseudoalteromonas]KJY96446.1 membrane protein [Pseudoalteromonas ruthenica]KJY97999.1 membrane protein [Pseudoalteromonas ruthenica]MCF2863605.1 DUF819 family protein [Pseudoalteromonas sp. CNAT2-18]MCG7546085.1 DUF819 family protein [Pseudoalteromonas sp. MM17-2]MCG7558558.1 DUF819 family protein [Pseudoalteromonas sp. CNAT2-18.1]|tara:strand:+ start:972 stop:2222 length:1251 start_codon:yes stop_codon:yes gene_type:complete